MHAVLIICNPDCLFPRILQAEVLKDPMQLEQQQPELGIAQPAQAQQAQHDAQQNAQPALQQPVLALLSSGLPPIVLGTFQGDMQRARIILEAAGFLVPFDISSSLLPPDLTSSSPLQHPAVPALPAGLWTAQPAAQQANSSSEGEEEGLLVQDPAASGAEQALTEGQHVGMSDQCIGSQCCMLCVGQGLHVIRCFVPCCTMLRLVWPAMLPCQMKRKERFTSLGVIMGASVPRSSPRPCQLHVHACCSAACFVGSTRWT